MIAGLASLVVEALQRRRCFAKDSIFRVAYEDLDNQFITLVLLTTVMSRTGGAADE
jgi:hypothetical protein